MSEKMFEVNILTPEKRIGSYTASLLVCPAVDGEIGILADHMPMICALKKGVCRINTENGTKNAEINGGVLFVKNNVADILCMDFCLKNGKYPGGGFSEG